ncbi:hypothetical protein D623_10004211 [Myotis brandtii]|uniref:Uncharacterized protein n=1 Tax=Myotis brandtii TaxID=109478 RepID=S7P434_MYOBR|nr:hypothetical protein D623_10004211 [Myotis brandtii]
MAQGHGGCLANTGPTRSVCAFPASTKGAVAVWVDHAWQEEEGRAHSKEGCGAVRRELKCGSPGPSPLALESSPFSSCQPSRKRVEVREGKAGEGKEDMRHHVCLAVTGSLQLEMTPQQQCLPLRHPQVS